MFQRLEGKTIGDVDKCRILYYSLINRNHRPIFSWCIYRVQVIRLVYPAGRKRKLREGWFPPSTSTKLPVSHTLLRLRNPKAHSAFYTSCTLWLSKSEINGASLLVILAYSILRSTNEKKNGFGAVAFGGEIKLGKSSLDELMTSRREREISREFLSEVETSRTCVYSTQFQSSISPWFRT